MSSELIELLKRGADKSTLSQIILPFCSDSKGERAPVALLSGNVNLKASLKKNGKPVALEDEIKKLESEALRTKKGQVVDLSNEIKRLQIDTNPSDDLKEVEIKEEWTAEDEILLRNRKSRAPIAPVVKDITNGNNKFGLDVDIEEMLRLAELEEEEETVTGNGNGFKTSKVGEIKREVKEIKLVQSKAGQPKELPKPKLPKINSANPLVGDIIEHTPEPPRKSAHDHSDQVSSRIILNELRRADLKASGNDIEEEVVETPISPVSPDTTEPTVPLKKSSLFSLRKQK